MSLRVKSGYIYRIRNRAAPDLLLELSNGSSTNGTQAQCWRAVNDTESFFNQLWLLTEIAIPAEHEREDTDAEPQSQKAWTLQNIRSGTFLDLAKGSTEPGTKIQGWQGPPKGKLDPDQDWILYWAIDGIGYHIANAKPGGLVVDLKNGIDKDGTPVWGWSFVAGNSNQIWDFEQWSYTSQELRSNVETKMPLKPDADVVKYTYAADPRYLILPYELYRDIWESSMEKYRYKEVLFDCDDFAFVYKAAVAEYGYDWLADMNVGQVALLAGIVYGVDRLGTSAHAYNWSMGPNTANDRYQPFTENPWYFEPQNGTPSFSTEYRIYFVIF